MTSNIPISTQPTSVTPGFNQPEVPINQIIYKSGNDYPNKWSKGLFDCWLSEDCEFYFSFIIINLLHCLT